MGNICGQCFTSIYDSLSLSLINEVSIEATAVSEDKKKRSISARALWDTGAELTVITPETAKKLGLRVISKTEIATPSGTMECSQYFVDLLLPNGVRIETILVTEAIPSNCDVLIGMNIIGLGDFAVTHFEGKTVFSFRVPSMQCIDFTKHSYLQPVEKDKNEQGRNELCSCGSGKKYKHCHGKQKTS
jgi:predicted aspartyl protease